MEAKHTPGPCGRLDMAYILSLPQPLIGTLLGGSTWPIYDIEVETGLVRIDVCGLLVVKRISDFFSVRDNLGIEHAAIGFFIDAIPDDRAPVCLPRAAIAKAQPQEGGE